MHQLQTVRRCRRRIRDFRLCTSCRPTAGAREAGGTSGRVPAADYQQVQACQEGLQAVHQLQTTSRLMRGRRDFRPCTSCRPPAGSCVGGETSGRAPAADHQQAHAWEERLQAVHQLQTTSRLMSGRRDFRPCTSFRPPAGSCVGLETSGRAPAADNQQAHALEERLQAVHQLQTSSRLMRGRRDFRPCTSCRPPAGSCVGGETSCRAPAADNQQAQAMQEDCHLTAGNYSII